MLVVFGVRSLTDNIFTWFSQLPYLRFHGQSKHLEHGIISSNGHLRERERDGQGRWNRRDLDRCVKELQSFAYNITWGELYIRLDYVLYASQLSVGCSNITILKNQTTQR